jgi:KaiC/GvpD/RAD55 family RecA-like ATPase
MTGIIDVAALKQRNVEQLFAASLFIRPIETALGCGWLMPDAITDPLIRRYWELARERITPAMSDEQAHQASVAAAMEADIIASVMSWSANLPYMDAPQAYADEIYRRRYLLDTSIYASKLMAAIGAQDDAAVAQIILEMAAQTNARRPIGQNADDASRLFAAVVNAGNRSIETFIPNFDAATGGLERQTLTVIAARPSMGKTALVWQIARNAAQSGRRVDMYSLEMSTASLWARAACPLVSVSWRDVRTGRIDAQRRAELLARSASLAEQYGDNLRIIDNGQTTDGIWRATAERRPDLIVVDHLRLIRDQMSSEVKRLGRITERLKDIAKTFDCAVLLAVQLNRAADAREDKRPTLADIRDSGEIEENADMIGMLYRNDYYHTAGETAKSDAELIIRKFRDGPTSVINLVFDVHEQWFYPAERRQL